WLAAVTVMDCEGTAGGGVYRPEEDMVPVVAFPLGTPLTLQVTPWSDVLETVAANCCDPPMNTVAVAGLTLTEIGGTGGVFPPPQPLIIKHKATLEITRFLVIRCISSPPHPETRSRLIT